MKSRLLSQTRRLNSTECTPFAFRIYATYEVPVRLADKEVHKIIDSLNPEIRSSEIYNGKPRKREFYAMSPEDAFNIFVAMATIHDCTHRLKLIPATIEEQAEEEEAIERQEKKRPFSFRLCNIPVGAEIEFCHSNENSGAICYVVDDKTVKYREQYWSLSSLARELAHGKNQLPGPKYFKYNGEWLNDIRARLGV